MSLIEKLGLEKCKAIVDGAPEWASGYSIQSRDYFSGSIWVEETEFYVDYLRTEISDHGTPTNEGTDNLSHFDHCSDIANHISPLTKVTER